MLILLIGNLGHLTEVMMSCGQGDKGHRVELWMGWCKCKQQGVQR